MNVFRLRLKNIGITCFILIAFFGGTLIFDHFFYARPLISALLSLAIFLISRFTDGYAYGAVASVIGVCVFNFVFAPYSNQLQDRLSDDIITILIMLAIAIMTGAMTTQIKENRKIKLESEKEKIRANLLRAVSHDLRTPLTGIYGSSSVLLKNKDKLSKEQQFELIKGIQGDSEWLIRMVENLLSVTKINQEGDVKLIKTPVVLEELMDSVLRKTKKRYPNCKIELELPDEFIIIPIDPMLIEQVILNLIQNAIQYAKGMTKISLQVVRKDNQVLFKIIDDGCGMDSSLTEEIPIDGKKHGMGIGLTVCNSIVEAHGGKMHVEDRKSGGCEVQFTLKLEEEQDEQ